MVTVKPWTASFVYQTAKPGTLTAINNNEEKPSSYASILDYAQRRALLHGDIFIEEDSKEIEDIHKSFVVDWLNLKDTSKLSKKLFLSHCNPERISANNIDAYLIIAAQLANSEQMKVLEEARQQWSKEYDVDLCKRILREAVMKNNFAISKHILDNCPAQHKLAILEEVPDNPNLNILKLAVDQENSEIAKLALDSCPKEHMGDYLFYESSDGSSSFSDIFLHDNREVLEYVLPLVPEYHQTQTDMSVLIKLAVENNSAEILEYFYQKDPEQTAKLVKEEKLLALAAAEPYPEALRVMVEASSSHADMGADNMLDLIMNEVDEKFLLKILDSYDETRLSSLITYDHTNKDNFFANAIDHGCFSLAEALIDKCPPALLKSMLESPDSGGRSPLMLSVIAQEMDLIKLIFEKYPASTEELFRASAQNPQKAEQNVFTAMFMDNETGVDLKILDYLLEKSPPDLVAELDDNLFTQDKASKTFLHYALRSSDTAILATLFKYYPREKIKKYLQMILKAHNALNLEALLFFWAGLKDDKDLEPYLEDYLEDSLQRIAYSIGDLEEIDERDFGEDISQPDLDAIIGIAEKGLIPSTLKEPSRLIAAYILDGKDLYIGTLRYALDNLLGIYPELLEEDGFGEVLFRFKEQNGSLTLDSNLLALVKLLRLAVQMSISLGFEDAEQAGDFVAGLINNKKTRRSLANWHKTMNAFSDNDAKSVVDTVKAITRYYILPRYIFKLPRELRKFISADSLKQLAKKLAPKVAMSLFDNKSLAEVLGLSKAWHHASRRIIHSLREIKLKGSWEPICPDFIAVNGLVIQPLLSADELVRESLLMNNCVEHYLENCLAGDLQIFSVQNKLGTIANFALKPLDEKDRISDEFLIQDPSSGKRFEIYQHEGYDNGFPPPESIAALKEFKKAIESKSIVLDAARLGNSIGLEGANTAFDYIGYEAVDESNKNSKLERSISEAFAFFESALEKSKNRLSQSQNQNTQRRVQRLLLRNYNYLKQVLLATKLLEINVPEPLLEQLEASMSDGSLNLSQIIVVTKTLQMMITQEVKELASSWRVDKVAKFLEQAYLIKKNFLFRDPRLKAIKFRDDMQEYLSAKQSLDEEANKEQRVNRRKALQHSGTPLIELADNKPKRFLNSKAEQESMREYFEERCFAGLIKLAA